MFIVLFKFLVPAAILFYFLWRFLGKHSLSKGALILLLISILFNTALAQNYNYSLIPYPERDGYSISNMLAYYVFGEDNFGHWNAELFKAGYEASINISIILLVLYLIFLFLESRTLQ
jgi:hypothetical protein